jgi:hypothetical protein
MAFDYELDDRGVRNFVHVVQTGSGDTQPPIQGVRGVCFPRAKAAEA